MRCQVICIMLRVVVIHRNKHGHVDGGELIVYWWLECKECLHSRCVSRYKIVGAAAMEWLVLAFQSQGSYAGHAINRVQ